MASNLKIIGILAAACAIVGGGIAWELSLWDECRQAFSASYCTRVLFK